MSDTLPILVVEDNAALAENIAEILAESGYTPTVVDTAEAALDALATSAFVGVVTDNRLPGMSGIELIAAMRAGGRHAPVVVVTAFADEGTVARAEELGALEVLSKPVDFERLFRLVDEFRHDEAKVLVVEDSRDIAEAIARTLVRHELTPIVAATMEAALAQRHLPHVAVLDLELPDGDGLALAQRLAARDPSIRVLLTAGCTEADVHEVRTTAQHRLGSVAQEVIPKPVDLERLAEHIARVSAGWSRESP